MYFEFYELKSWGKRSANNRRRFNQRLLKGRLNFPTNGNWQGGIPLYFCRVNNCSATLCSIMPKKHTGSHSRE